MPSFAAILRTLLAVTFALLPLLCCCGSAEAGEAVRVTQTEADHGCCTSDADLDDPVPAMPEPGCADCGSHLEMMPDARAETPSAAGAASELPCFQLLALPRLIAVVSTTDAPPTFAPAPPGATTPAPTLRALSVLLLT